MLSGATHGNKFYNPQKMQQFMWRRREEERDKYQMKNPHSITLLFICKPFP